MDPFKEFGLKSGLGTSLDKNANIFWCITYISQAVAAKKPIVFVSSRYSTMTYRLCCSKLIIRYDPALVKFIEVSELLGNTLEADFGKISLPIQEAVTSVGASSIVFDDCSLFERLGASSTDIAYSLLDLYASLPEDGVLFAQFAIATQAYKLLESSADFSLNFETIGSGFGKNVTGKIAISRRGAELLTEKRDLLYYTGDRGTKFFYPGNVPLQL